MAPPAKSSVTRRKSAGGKALTVTLHVSSDRLKEIVNGASSQGEETPVVQDSPKSEEKEVKEEVKETNGAVDSSTPTSTPSNTVLPVPAAPSGENASDSNPATPAANGEGTPVPAVMGPPTEGPKKKGTKRSAGAANGLGPDGLPKVRGKPGPKKKARLEDGTIDPNARTPAGAHKLGPKANQGAINAGLRALDRSGAPCRKWNRGGFRLKSFTGVVWEISRWTAPPKSASQPASDESATASAENSTKENPETQESKESKPELALPKSDVNSTTANSAVDVDVEMNSGPPSAVAASSPAPTPMPISAAS